MTEYFSQYGQDQYLEENVFKGKRNGVFVEIGAFNGLGMSNTAFFEREREWTGILFEPIPTRYAEVVKNRKCLAMQACVSDREGEEEFTIMEGWTEMLSGITRTYDPAHVQRINSELSEYGGTKKIVKVASVLLDKTLTYHGMHHVDYCSIDTEGSEFQILQSIDFGKVSIYCFTVENNYSDDRVERFMKEKGYLKDEKKFGTDELYFKV
jgi:FkbM family methyltransferase